MTTLVMRRVFAAMAAVTMTAAVAACRYQPEPVPLLAAPADIAALAGRWEGQYLGRESGRSGSIVFMIAAGKDTAYGDVLMGRDPGNWGPPITAADAATGEHARHASSAELLRVSFVRIRGGRTEGKLEPYIAPDCHCTVTTTFRGAITDNVIQGDYVTRGPDGLQQTGTWSVTRKTMAADIVK
jgi:hypothetical protein